MTKEKTGFAKLKEINVNEHVEKKNNFSYLSWPWALSTLMENDPEAEWSHPEEKVFNDGTVMVYCIVKAFGKERKAHLPVMDYKNAPVKNPSAFQINTAMQRCFVKAIALHGLGLYLYAGEDLPDADNDKKPVAEKPVEFTREHKMTQRDILYAVSNSETLEDIDSVNDQYAQAFEDLPEAMLDVINDAMGMKRTQIEKGVKPIPGTFGFIDVEEAEHYLTNAFAYIDKQTDVKRLSEWITKVDFKLKALDKSLKAGKWKDAGVPPYQQVIAKYNDKLEKLKGQ